MLPTKLIRINKKFNSQDELYKIGKLWKTRQMLRGFSYVDKKEINVNVPKDQFVILLSYFIDNDYNEFVEVLWENKIIVFYGIDAALDFNLNPEKSKIQ